MADLNIDRAAVRALERNKGVLDGLNDVGRQLAEAAKVNAPRRTGAGAASIRHELGEDEHGPWVHVSWNRDHFYMGFNEFGTSKMNAHPFLRTALDRHYTV